MADGNLYFNRSSCGVIETAEIVAEAAHAELCGVFGHHGRRWGVAGKGRRRRTLGRGSAEQFLGYGSSRIGCAHQRLEVRSRNGLRTSSC